MRNTEIIIVYETPVQSLLSDLSTFFLFFGLIGIGVSLDSSAMQWVGAIIGFFVVVSRAHVQNARYTIDGARKRLAEIEAKTGGEA